MLEIAVALAVVGVGLLLFYARQKQNYWQLKGVDVPPFWPVIGHLYGLIFIAHRWKYIDKLYNQYRDKRLWGMYQGVEKQLFLVDREIMKDVLVKNADHFTDRRAAHYNKSVSRADEISSEMLLWIQGEKWKNLRNLLTPTFTSSKIKAMFPLICSSADNLVSYLEEQNSQHSFVEVRDALGKYTLSVIASCAFGLELPVAEGTSEFAKNAKIVSSNFFNAAKIFILKALPSKISNLLGLQLAPEETIFFEKVVKETIDARRESGVRRGDFLDLLQDAWTESEGSDNPKYRMTFTSVVAQSILFVVGGFDTTSNSLAFIAYLLGKHQDVQTKLREELQKILKSDGQFTYHNILDAHYLDACFSESLRLYGPAHALERICTRNYRIPDTEIVIEKGTLVSIPNWSIDHDPLYWENPHKFNPERFLPENKEHIKPYTHQPFGLGPRNCIAMRFAQMETKIAIAKMVLNHQITLPPGHEEIVLNKETFFVRATHHGIRINFHKIKH